MPTARSLQDIIRRRQQSIIVGRKEQIERFQTHLGLDPEDDRRAILFNIWGQGGVGKTYLVRHYQKMAADRFDAITGYADEGPRDVPGVLALFARQFEEQLPGQPCKRFAERYKVYLQKREELEADSEAPKGLAAIAGRTAVKGALRLAEEIPFAGVAIDLADGDAIADRAGDWTGYIARKIGNKDEVKLVLSPEETLTPLFVRDLHDIAAKKQRLALFFDTYEKTCPFLESWLLKLLEGVYGDLPLDITIAIAGRDKLNADRWGAYEPILASLPLEPFTEEEARDYLRSKNITDPQVQKTILHLSNRLPLLVATLAAGNPDDPSEIADGSDMAIARFLKWVHDPQKRQIALDAALLRRLDRDAIAALIDNTDARNTDTQNTDAGELFEWLKHMPFVLKRTQGWAYHDVVRSLMLRYKRQESQRIWTELHGKMAAFYKECQNSLGLDAEQAWSDEKWQESALETLYHNLCGAYRRFLPDAIGGFLQAFGEEKDFAKKWVLAIQQAGRDAEEKEVQRWGDDLVRGIEAWNEDNYEVVYEMFGKLLDCKDLQAKQRVIAFTQRGRACNLMGRSEKGIVNFNQAIGLDSSDEKAIAGRGKTYQLMGRYNEAIADFNRAIELDSEYTWAISERGCTYRLMKLYDETLTDFNRVIELDSEYTWAIVSRGQTCRLMGRYDEALVDFNRAIELDSEYAWAIANRGQTYRLMGHYNEAVVDFNRAIELDPEDDWAIANRGEIYRLIKHYDEAINDFSRAIELDPNCKRAIANRGETYRLMKRYDEALVDFNCAIELDSDYKWAIASRGEIYRLMEHYDEALIDFNRAIELDPEYDWAIVHRGQTYQSMQQYKKALADFNRAIELDPEDNWVIAERGNIYGLMERYDEALADFDAASALGNNSWINRGLVLSYLGRYSEATESYQKELKANVNCAALYNIAVVSVRWKSWEEAKEEVEKARQAFKQALDTNAGAALYGLGGLEALEGNAEAALDLLQKAIPLEKEAAIWARQDIAWLDLRSDPRFQKLVPPRSPSNS